MKPKYPLVAAAVSAALTTVTGQPLAAAADSCTSPSATVCPPEAPPPTDSPEQNPEPAVVENPKGEQGPPPPPMPPGRGMTYAMEQEPPWPGYSAVFATLPQHGSAPIIDAINRSRILSE
jgi:hypothetical protein